MKKKLSDKMWKLFSPYMLICLFDLIFVEGTGVFLTNFKEKCHFHYVLAWAKPLRIELISGNYTCMLKKCIDVY